jgi:hypothetical protein
MAADDRKPLSRIARTMKRGALTETAHRAGYSTAAAYCAAKKRTGLSGKRCALARTFAKYRRGRGASRR